MDKIKLVELSRKIIKWDRWFLPRISVHYLFLVLCHSQKFPDVHKKALEELLNCRILSYSESGNYFVQSPLYPNFFINPELDNEKLYFTLREHCQRFANKLDYEMKTTSLMVVRKGEFNISNNPSPKEWAIIRFKSNYRYEEIFEKLIDKGIINRKRKENFSVVYMLPHPYAEKRKYLNLKEYSEVYPEVLAKPKKYYFTKKEYAEAYRESFLEHIKSDIKVVQH